jgi:restriction system protein
MAEDRAATASSDAQGPWTRHLVSYATARAALGVLDGVLKADLLALLRAIWEQVGTPQQPVDWSDPNRWIAERLTDNNALLARQIWAASERAVNPRHLYRIYLFLSHHRLLVVEGDGVLQVSPRGKRFLADDAPTMAEIDAAEGVPRLLALLAAAGPMRRTDLLPRWRKVWAERSPASSDAAVRDSLASRLANLAERGLIGKDGQWVELTGAGEAALGRSPVAPTEPTLGLLRALRDHNDAELTRLHDVLAAMPPHRFEELVGQVLEAMGYEDVEVTKASGDKGVDVAATIQVGITAVREVVQVKRHAGSIQRPVVDQLRGVLPLHGAIRGTIITLGTFSRGCEEVATHHGAAPITLIDGQRFMELLVEHEIGITRRTLSMYELDAAPLMAPDEEPASAV